MRAGLRGAAAFHRAIPASLSEHPSAPSGTVPCSTQKDVLEEGPLPASVWIHCPLEASSLAFAVPTHFGLTPPLVPFWAWLRCSSSSPRECHCPRAPRASCHTCVHSRGCVCPSPWLSRKQVAAAAWRTLGTFVNCCVSLHHV